MSDRFKIAETDSFKKKIQKVEYKRLYRKIEEYVYPLLRRNPFFGPNIKRLKGNYLEFFRFFIGDYRLFYKIYNDKIIVFTIDIVHRRDAYK